MTGIVHSYQIIIWKSNDKCIRTTSQEEIFLQQRNGSVPNITTHVGEFIMFIQIWNAFGNLGKLHHSIIAAAAVVALLALGIHKIGEGPLISVNRQEKSLKGIITGYTKGKRKTRIGDAICYPVLCQSKRNIFFIAVLQLKIIGSIRVLEHFDHKSIILCDFAVFCSIPLGRLIYDSDIIIICLDVL